MSLTLIRGLPGSGKSTLAMSMCDNYDSIHIEADMYHVVNGTYHFDPAKIKDAHKWCQDTARVLLNNGYDVVVSNTFTQHWEMEPYLQMTKDVSVIVCVGEYKNIHNVPEEILIKMKQRWED